MVIVVLNAKKCKHLSPKTHVVTDQIKLIKPQVFFKKGNNSLILWTHWSGQGKNICGSTDILEK